MTLLGFGILPLVNSAGEPAMQPTLELVNYKDGGVYSGYYFNGRRHGQGSYLYPNQSFYSGAWAYGEKQGWGIYQWPNGNIYEGEWQGNVAQGQGTLTYADGGMFTGQWNRGKPYQTPESQPASPGDAQAQAAEAAAIRATRCRQIRTLHEAYLRFPEPKPQEPMRPLDLEHCLGS